METKGLNIYKFENSEGVLIRLDNPKFLGVDLRRECVFYYNNVGFLRLWTIEKLGIEITPEDTELCYSDRKNGYSYGHIDTYVVPYNVRFDGVDWEKIGPDSYPVLISNCVKKTMSEVFSSDGTVMHEPGTPYIDLEAKSGQYRYRHYLDKEGEPYSGKTIEFKFSPWKGTTPQNKPILVRIIAK